MSDPTLADAILKLTSVLERLEQKLDAALPETGGKQEAAKLLGITTRTLHRRMLELEKGVHYWDEGGKVVFDLELLRDWQRNRNDPAAHLRAIENRRKQLLSQQSQKKRK
ncbi:helix-turn-helix domain-containing protein [Leptolyngbya ohadii]|uniref:helix-turn-helix domain-containing protein n=1 Tax=Leptolyngbya ohadii TaxID=1962290 RepID=UPI0015C63827|nr:helix-turn-helix domain-containing protein [Leptolyngbya ohadii]